MKKSVNTLWGKRAVAAAVAATTMLVVVPVFAGLTIIEESKEAKPPLTPQKIIEEGTRARDENARLSAEIDRLQRELQIAKQALEAALADKANCQAKLAQVSNTLDDIERQMEDVGTAILRVNFGFGSSKFEPTKEARQALVAAGKKAKRVNVRGHADNSGATEINRRVALERALAAKRYLIAQGVDKDKVFAFSHGSADPVGDNSTAEGRAKNRRVDVEFVK